MNKIRNITLLLLLCALFFTDDGENKSYNNRYFTSKNGVLMNVNVWGAVLHPGLHSVPEGIDFPGLMSIVGGPINGAKIKNVKLIRYQPESSKPEVYRINLKKFFKYGDRSDFVRIMPNDTIIVEHTIFSSIALSTSTINTIVSIINLVFFINYQLENDG